MTTQMEIPEALSALESLQGDLPEGGRIGSPWLDAHRDAMTAVLDAYGAKRTSELLGLSLNALNTWRRRRGLQDDRFLGNAKHHSRLLAPHVASAGATDEEPTGTEGAVAGMGYDVVEVDPDLILPNPWQPRRTLHPEDVEAVAESIDSVGLLQVPLGRPSEGGRVQLAFGHTRVEGIRRLISRGRWARGVPLTLRSLTDQEMVTFAFAENGKRRDLTPYEEIRGYQKALAEVEGLTVTALSERLGIDRSTLSNHLRILRLPQVVLDRVESGELSPRAAREFLCLMSDDHVHEEDMARVIGHMARSLGVPDWRVEHVRSLIRDQVTRANVEGWRPLAADSSVQPTFDVEAYKTAHPAWVHSIPDSRSAAPWTCNVREWRRLQSAGTRAINKAREESAAPQAPEEPAGQPAAEGARYTEGRDSGHEPDRVSSDAPASMNTGSVSQETPAVERTETRREKVLPKPAYACASPSCGRVWDAEDLVWWLGGPTHGPGWYCINCIFEKVLTDVGLALTPLDEHLHPDETSPPSPWRGVVLRPVPTYAPTPLYPCDSCRSACGQEGLRWDEESTHWLCGSCN